MGKGHRVKPLPPDEVFAVKPSACCAGCGSAPIGDDPEPHRHQVVEIPPISIFVTEHLLHVLTCGGCGHTTRATLPDGVQQSQFGPDVSAIVATLLRRDRVSRRDTKQRMADVFGLRISLGSISNIEVRVSNGLGPFNAEALEDMRDADVEHTCETTRRQRGQSAYLWLAATLTTVGCLIRDSRSGEVAKELSRETPTGITDSGRYVAYNHIDEEQRQVCWAHLRRDSVAIAVGVRGHRSIGVKPLKLTDESFKPWHSL